MRKFRNEQTMGEYLALLSTKYNVYSSELFYALIEAGENKEASCGKLNIECRTKTEENLTFLIKNGAEVVAQFPVSTAFLFKQDNSMLNSMDEEVKRRRTNEKAEPASSYAIRDLHAGMSHLNLKAKVLEISAQRRVTTRYGNYATLAKALIEDETGTIKLCLWNEQINSVSVGETILIGDARASRFQGETQLSIGTKGTINNDNAAPKSFPIIVPVARAKTPSKND